MLIIPPTKYQLWANFRAKEIKKFLGLLSLFDIILNTKMIFDEWRKNLFIPIFKINVKHKCLNYRGINLICDTLKLWKSIIDYRL